MCSGINCVCVYLLASGDVWVLFVCGRPSLREGGWSLGPSICGCRRKAGSFLKNFNSFLAVWWIYRKSKLTNVPLFAIVLCCHASSILKYIVNLEGISSIIITFISGDIHRHLPLFTVLPIEWFVFELRATNLFFFN